ncbi:MAG: hypothetical protein ACYTFW_23565 [Planctomycetota bacterium]|jgi:hypothetical protein
MSSCKANAENQHNNITEEQSYVSLEELAFHGGDLHQIDKLFLAWLKNASCNAMNNQ